MLMNEIDHGFKNMSRKELMLDPDIILFYCYLNQVDDLEQEILF